MRKHYCLLAILALVMLPLAGTASAAPLAVIDQTSSYNTGWLNSYYHWQQGIRSSVAGQLMGIDMWCLNAGQPIGMSIWLGAPWHADAPLYQTSYTCTTADQWYYVDLSAGGIMLAAEQDFTVGIYSGANTWFGDGDYDRGDLYLEGSYFSYADMAFRTYMESPAAMDIQLDAFGTGNGSDVVQVAYTLSGMGGAAFDLGFYASADTVFDGGDTLLSTYTVTDPADLTDGSHTLDLTLGADINLVTEAMSPFFDHYILAVADPVDAVAETDETNNTGPFSGVYQYDPGPLPAQTSVWVHGTDGADLIVASPNGGVNINGALSGPHDQIYAFMIYSHGDADTLDLGLTPYGAYSGSWAGPGDDILKLSPWLAYVDGGDGSDTLNALHFTTQIQVDLAAGNAGWATGNTPVMGYEHVVGTPFDDTLNGDGNANTLDGQGGADRLRGFGGDDMLLGGPGYDSLWGGDGNDVLRAQADGGQVWGDAGNDSIRGSDVADALSGGPDDDDIWPGLGLDVIRGDDGVDTVDFFHPTNTNGVWVELNNKTAQDQEGNTESITGVENVLGTPYVDYIQGDWSDNFLFGRAGNDTLFGMSGNDVLWGGASTDDGEGGDYLDGGAGDDALYSNDDTCVDDGAADHLVGSNGTDTGYGASNEFYWPSTEIQVPCP